MYNAGYIERMIVPNFLSYFLNKMKFVWDFVIELQKQATWLPFFAKKELPMASLLAMVKNNILSSSTSKLISAKLLCIPSYLAGNPSIWLLKSRKERCLFIHLFILFYSWLIANEITVYNKNGYVYIHANWRQLPNVEKMKIVN